jgi:hypothetical protein
MLRDLGRYDEALECNARALSLMEVGAARKVRETILAKRTQESTGAPGV